jgi:hypothetical protein
MSYVAGFYVVSQFCSPRCETIVRREAELRTYEARMSAVAGIFDELVSSILSVVEQTQNKVPPVHWFEETDVELPREASPLLEAIIVRKVRVVMVEGLSYRNGYAGRKLDLGKFWDAVAASQLTPEDFRRITLAEAERTIAAKSPKAEAVKQDSLRPTPVA